MDTVKADIKYKEPAGRLELFIRILWAIPLAIVVSILQTIGGLCMCLQWIYILLLGKRNATLHKYIVLCMKYTFKASAYVSLATDERAPIMPEDL